MVNHASKKGKINNMKSASVRHNEWMATQKKYSEEDTIKWSLKSCIKCIFGFHNWGKFMGPENIGGGKFKQKYICIRCKHIKAIIS